MNSLSAPNADLLFQGGSEMHARCRVLDWSQTSLGPVSDWPVSLRTAAQLVLASPFPNIILWGPQLVQIYNDGYRKLMGQKHPAGLSQPTQQCWPEVWYINQPIYERVWAGESFAFEDTRYPITRSGQLEDAWFTLAYSPVWAESGQVGGVLVTVFETTSQVLEKRHHQQTRTQSDFLLRLIDSLRALADPDAIQYAAISALGQHLGANRVGYAETQPNTDWVAITRHYTQGVAGIEGLYRYADYGPDLINRMQQGQTVVRADIANDPALTHQQKQAHTKLALGATLNVPLVKESHLVAILFVHFQQPHPFSTDEVALAEEIAHQTWAALERARAEEALRRSEERYRHLSAELEERVQARTHDLSQVNADLKRSNDNLQQFAYVASHDLQEPLRKIQSFSTLLSEYYTASLDEAGLDLLRRMQRAGERMSTLIRDLLAYSRIATRQEAFGSISLESVVSEVVSMLDWQIQQTKAQLVIDALPIVNGDATQLSQLFQNLLTNALKFVQEGEAPSVHIQYACRQPEELPIDVHPAQQSASYHQISVKDEGIGFDPKYVDRIFQVFQRLHGKNQFTGSGVGLAICQRVAENHGGAITAASQPGVGTTFYVYLPA